MTKIYHLLKREYQRTQDYKPVILLTGAGSGIGLALARVLYKCSEYRVIITARGKNIRSLQDEFMETERFVIGSLDVTLESDREKIMAQIRENWGGVDILINNAGISFRAVVEHMSEQDEYLQMAANYFGPMALVRLALPYMREKGRGKIINVSSVSGMLAMPTMAAYSASKHALEGASEALWYEAKPFGIDVSLIQPGFVHSSSFKNVYTTEKYRATEGHPHPYEDFYSNMGPFIEKLMNFSPTTPEDIARDILKIIRTEKPNLWNSVTWDARIFYYLRRFLPRRFLLPFLYAFLPNARSWALKYTKRRGL